MSTHRYGSKKMTSVNEHYRGFMLTHMLLDGKDPTVFVDDGQGWFSATFKGDTSAKRARLWCDYVNKHGHLPPPHHACFKE